MLVDITANTTSDAKKKQMSKVLAAKVVSHGCENTPASLQKPAPASSVAQAVHKPSPSLGLAGPSRLQSLGRPRFTGSRISSASVAGPSNNLTKASSPSIASTAPNTSAGPTTTSSLAALATAQNLAGSSVDFPQSSESFPLTSSQEEHILQELTNINATALNISNDANTTQNFNFHGSVVNFYNAK